MVTTTARHVRILATALVASIIVALIVFSYHSFEFKGGVGILDSGFFSYPRYRAQLGDLPSWKTGEYTFVVRGLPPGPLDLELQVPDATDTERVELTYLSTFVTASITESSGKEICYENGTLSDAGNRDRPSWILASSNSSVSFWQPRCQHLPISRFKTYTAKVNVSSVDDRSPRKMLRPVLLGGGNELP